jgi:uncharacterized RDD family membrane protein YckC
MSFSSDAPQPHDLTKPAPPQFLPPTDAPGPPVAPPPPPPTSSFAAPAVSYELSGWWRRAGALLLDNLFVGVFLLAIAVLAGLAFGFDRVFTEDEETGNAAGILLWAGFSLGSTIAYYCLLMARNGARNGQTWGRQITGIRAVWDDGRPCTFSRALVRQILVINILFESLMVFTLYIGTLLNYLWPLWDRENQALHDKIASTHVVRADDQPATWQPQT